MKTDGVFVDAGLLRDHVSKLRNERKIALELYESVVAMRNLSDPETNYQYSPLLADIYQLVDYFTVMARKLDEISDDAVLLQKRIEGILVQDTIELRNTVKKTFSL